MAHREGELIGNYRLIHFLEYRIYSEVYLAEDVRDSHLVSVALLPYVGFYRNEFFKRVHRLIQLKHPHILQLQDFGVGGKDDSWASYLIFNNPRMTSLRSHHPKGSILPLNTIVAYVKQIASALQYAHNADFINTYVTPENMFIWNNDEIIVGGFESQLEDGSGESPFTEERSIYDPSDVRNTPASDQYSLSVVTYEWLCGNVPFHDHRMKLFDQHDLVTPPHYAKRIPSFLMKSKQ